MRTKEIEQALELLEKIKISESMNVYIGVKDIKKVNALLKYIEELEEEKRHMKYLLNKKKFFSEYYVGEIICCEDIKELLKGE